MLIYISGPYRGDTKDDISDNIENARNVAIEIWEKGYPYVAICPHLNTAHFEEDASLTHEEYIAGDLAILARCDAIVMIEGWEHSEGAKIELDFAEQSGIPVFYYPDLPVASQTEIRRELQVQEFMRIIMRMYRIHLSKNADYSPANILGAGEIGLATRTWDKVSRLMNLMGFRLEISSMAFEKPTNPKHESVDDTVIDLGVYSIIWQIYRKGKWGK